MYGSGEDRELRIRMAESFWSERICPFGQKWKDSEAAASGSLRADLRRARRKKRLAVMHVKF